MDIDERLARIDIDSNIENVKILDMFLDSNDQDFLMMWVTTNNTKVLEKTEEILFEVIDEYVKTLPIPLVLRKRIMYEKIMNENIKIKKIS